MSVWLESVSVWLESMSASTSIAVARRAALLLAHPQPSTLLNNLHSCTYFLCVHNSAVSGCECGGCEGGVDVQVLLGFLHALTHTQKHTLTPHCAWLYATLKMRVLISLSECGFYICLYMCIYVHVHVLISC